MINPLRLISNIRVVYLLMAILAIIYFSSKGMKQRWIFLAIAIGLFVYRKFFYKSQEVPFGGRAIDTTVDEVQDSAAKRQSQRINQDLEDIHIQKPTKPEDQTQP